MAVSSVYSKMAPHGKLQRAHVPQSLSLWCVVFKALRRLTQVPEQSSLDSERGAYLPLQSESSTYALTPSTLEGRPAH